LRTAANDPKRNFSHVRGAHDCSPTETRAKAQTSESAEAEEKETLMQCYCGCLLDIRKAHLQSRFLWMKAII